MNCGQSRDTHYGRVASVMCWRVTQSFHSRVGGVVCVLIHGTSTSYLSLAYKELGKVGAPPGAKGMSLQDQLVLQLSAAK